MASTSRKQGIGRRHLSTLMALTVFTPITALAQQVPAAPEPAVAAPSESAMVNLVRALIAQGALKADVGEALLRQAEAEVAQARTQVGRELPAPAAGAIRVPYIPESVRAQIKDELRSEVMAEAKQGQWASPEEAAPDWTRRITLHGDIRVRSQSDLYARTNSNEIEDFGLINSFGPYDIEFANSTGVIPTLNSRNDKWNHMRLRARLGIDVVVAKGVTAGITLATGDNSGPISTNSVLGGGFLKRDLWLDKAWINLAPIDNLNVTFGRFANPFDSSDLLYDPDLSFDGVAVRLDSGSMLSDNFSLSLRGGAFPYDFGSPNYPSSSFDKPTTAQKYLFAAQLAADARFDDIDARVSVGLHDFHNFQGKFSTECFATDTFCSTDDRQPIFLTKGNTLSPLRNLIVISNTDYQPQLLGYTFKYRVLDVNASVSVPLDDEIKARLTGSFVKNLGFKLSDICRNGFKGRPLNNAVPGSGIYCDTESTPARFAGGDTGYRAEVRIGTMDPRKRGQWNAFAGYRYLESDAVLDALTESDFHLGGTNAKGYFVGGNFAAWDNVLIGGRWMSANEVSGPPLAIDVLQLDLQVNF